MQSPYGLGYVLRSTAVWSIVVILCAGATILEAALDDEVGVLFWLPFVGVALGIAVAVRRQLAHRLALPTVSSSVSRAAGFPVRVYLASGVDACAEPFVWRRGGRVILGSAMLDTPARDYVLWHEVGHLAARRTSLRALNMWVLDYFSGGQLLSELPRHDILNIFGRMISEVRGLFAPLLGPVVRAEEFAADAAAAERLGVAAAVQGMNAYARLAAAHRRDPVALEAMQVRRLLGHDVPPADETILEARDAPSWYPRWDERIASVSSMPVRNRNAPQVPWPHVALVGDGIELHQDRGRLHRCGKLDVKAIVIGIGFIYFSMRSAWLWWYLRTASAAFVTGWTLLFGVLFLAIAGWKARRQLVWTFTHEDLSAGPPAAVAPLDRAIIARALQEVPDRPPGMGEI